MVTSPRFRTACFNCNWQQISCFWSSHFFHLLMQALLMLLVSMSWKMFSRFVSFLQSPILKICFCVSYHNFLLQITCSYTQGAATTCYVALHPDVKGMTGKYYADSNLAETSPLAKDNALAKRLWDFTLGLTEQCKEQWGLQKLTKLRTFVMDVWLFWE